MSPSAAAAMRHALRYLGQAPLSSCLKAAAALLHCPPCCVAAATSLPAEQPPMPSWLLLRQCLGGVHDIAAAACPLSFHGWYAGVHLRGCLHGAFCRSRGCIHAQRCCMPQPQAAHCCCMALAVCLLACWSQGACTLKADKQWTYTRHFPSQTHPMHLTGSKLSGDPCNAWYAGAIVCPHMAFIPWHACHGRDGHPNCQRVRSSSRYGLL